MKIIYVGKNIEITEAMKSIVDEKLSRLGYYFNSDKEARVIMSTQKSNQKVEVTIYLKDLIIRAEEVSEDMYVAIDLVVDKLERMLRKQKTKLQKKQHQSIKYQALDSFDEMEECDSNKVVKRKTITSKPMTDEEAILQLELLHHDFYMYVNSNGLTSVVYKRKDGDYGIIETC